MADKITVLVAKLLNQAENAATEAEASTFMAKAQTLATDHSVDLAIARQVTAKAEQREQPEVRNISVGPRGAKGNAKKVRLISAIAGVNSVTLNIFHDSHGVIAYGFPSDIDMVEALYNSLVVQMTSAGDAYIKSGEYKKETTTVVRKVKVGQYYTFQGWRNEYDREVVTKPVDGRVARASFYDGFTSRIRHRLQMAANEAIETYDARHQEEVTDESGVKPVGFDSAPGAALALVQKEVEVRDFYKAKSTARGSWRGGSSSGHSSHGTSAGRAAGDRARLSSTKALA